MINSLYLHKVAAHDKQTSTFEELKLLVMGTWTSTANKQAWDRLQSADQRGENVEDVFETDQSDIVHGKAVGEDGCRKALSLCGNEQQV